MIEFFRRNVLISTTSNIEAYSNNYDEPTHACSYNSDISYAQACASPLLDEKWRNLWFFHTFLA
jgi:hypothetical protein